MSHETYFKFRKLDGDFHLHLLKNRLLKYRIGIEDNSRKILKAVTETIKLIRDMVLDKTRVKMREIFEAIVVSKNRVGCVIKVK